VGHARRSALRWAGPWKEVAFVKVALPHRYKLGFKFFDVEIFSISLCGESGLITDKNVRAHRRSAAVSRMEGQREFDLG
jgi:hypothetical protein